MANLYQRRLKLSKNMKEIRTAKNAQCPCGEIVPINLDDEGDYDVLNVICPKCHRHGTGGNGRTGKVTSWMTEEAIERANEEYRYQCWDADNNEWYGRGNW